MPASMESTLFNEWTLAAESRCARELAGLLVICSRRHGLAV